MTLGISGFWHGVTSTDYFVHFSVCLSIRLSARSSVFPSVHMRLTSVILVITPQGTFFYIRMYFLFIVKGISTLYPLQLESLEISLCFRFCKTDVMQ